MVSEIHIEASSLRTLKIMTRNLYEIVCSRIRIQYRSLFTKISSAFRTTDFTILSSLFYLSLHSPLCVIFCYFSFTNNTLYVACTEAKYFVILCTFCTCTVFNLRSCHMRLTLAEPPLCMHTHNRNREKSSGQAP